jgi:hypothetical protein
MTIGFGQIRKTEISETLWESMLEIGKEAASDLNLGLMNTFNGFGVRHSLRDLAPRFHKMVKGTS